jgi:hypothetical protein
MSDSLDGARTARREKIALTNVRVFDGRGLRGPTTVVGLTRYAAPLLAGLSVDRLAEKVFSQRL